MATTQAGPGTTLPSAPTRSRLDRRIGQILALVALLDVGMLLLAGVLAWRSRASLDVWLSAASIEATLLSGSSPWVLGTWLVGLVFAGAYSRRTFATGFEEFHAVTMGSLGALGAIGTVAFLLHSQMSRGFLVFSFLYGIPLLLLGRYAARKVIHLLRRTGRLQHRVVAVASPATVREVDAELRRASHAGYRIVGACLPDAVGDLDEELPVPVLGHVGDVVEACARVGADTVLVAGGSYSSSRDLRRIGWSLEGNDVDLIVVPSLVDVAGPRINMRNVAGLPFVHVEEPQSDRAGGLSKRLFDLVLTLVLTALASPALLAVAIAVKLQDGGPVLFSQQRIGRDGTVFQMRKFRTMVVGAEARLDELRHLNEADQVLFKVRDDPRTTRVGRFLRRYSLDELPQLLNVWRGEMSLVGPRPPLPDEVEAYESDVHRRLLVRPGMTGLWQVSGRSDLMYDEAVRLDLSYVDNWSMVSDLIIIAKTVRAVLGSAGAY